MRVSPIIIESSLGSKKDDVSLVVDFLFISFIVSNFRRDLRLLKGLVSCSNLSQRPFPFDKFRPFKGLSLST